MRAPETRARETDRLVLEVLGAASIGLMAGVLGLQVVMRYVLNSPLSWPEELARYLMIWATFIGAALLVREDGHVRLDYFRGLLRGKLRLFAEIIDRLAAGLFLLSLLWGSWLLLEGPMVRFRSPALQLPLVAVMAIVPLTSLCMLAYTVRQAWVGTKRLLVDSTT